jgi:pectinesterase inhibitor-like protein
VPAYLYSEDIYIYLGTLDLADNLVLSSASTTLAQVKKLLPGAKGSALPVCSSIYGRIISEKVPNAYKKLDSRAYVAAASVMTDVMNQAETCEMVFLTGHDQGKSPITDKNKMVMALSDKNKIIK